MTFDVEIGGLVRQVQVRREGTLLRVEMDGRARVVDARRIGDEKWSLLIGDEGQSPLVCLDAALTPQPAAGAFDVHLYGHTIPVQIREADARGRRRRASAGASSAGLQRLVSPMPGKVIRVLAAAGDAVKARQGLVVVEAMKMENELRATRDGRVREVVVREGQSVEAGTVLMVVE